MNQQKSRACILESDALNCAQKVVSLFCEQCGISQETALRIAHPFGGGLRAGEACGALAGALMIVGLTHGNPDPRTPEDRAACDVRAAEFSRRFKELNGHITCRDLLGIDTSVGENRALANAQGVFRSVCPSVIENTVRLLEELGYGE